jgi:hypothetical protein
VDVPVFCRITIEALTGYTSQIGIEIKSAIAAYINSLAIGANVVHSRVYSPANLGVVSGGNARYYDITELLIGKSVSSLAAANISVAFDQSASCDINNIELVVT